MARVTLTIPDAIIESLPEDGSGAVPDMRRAVAGWEERIEHIREADPSRLVEAIDRLEDRWERYDTFVVELRAWGQSPIYAMAWRDLHGALLRQLYDDESIADRIDRERNARIVEDGIRRQD